MFQKINRFLKKIILICGYSISKRTSYDQLLQFLSDIRPYKTNHELIRLGGDGDGGYLVPKDIDMLSACFSPGVSSVATFEEDLAKKGIKCFLADYSVDGPPIDNKLFFFDKKYLGSESAGIYISLDDWVNSNSRKKDDDLILQMDIEGSEYEVLMAAKLDTLKRFRIIIVEFHNLDWLYNLAGYKLINHTFKKLLQEFDVVHIHPNNCSSTVSYKNIEIPPVMEFTFLRKDRVNIRKKSTEFPHSLDEPNLKTMKDFPLPPCWYS